MELTMQIVPHERTVRLKEVRALAGGDVCSLLLSGARDALPDLRLALYTGADMETLVASCVSFSEVPGHPSDRTGTLDLMTEEMGDWFSAELERLGDEESEAKEKGRRVPPRDPSAPVPAWGWLLVFDSARTWVSCRVPVLLRPSDPGADGVTPIGPVLAGKADKVPSATPGNLASLDASGNLADSGATPESIKAAAVAEVVANAPGTMDTLKEIADILGSSQEAGTVLKRVLDLEGGKVDKVPGKGLSANDYTNADKAKLAGIAAGATAVTIDSALSRTSENPVQNKVVSKALYTGFTEWEFGGDAYSGEHCTVVITGPVDGYYTYHLMIDDSELGSETYTTDDVLFIPFAVGPDATITATRHLITPTKTSQLTNDGPSSGPNVGHPFATTNQIPAPVDISGKLDGEAAYPAWSTGIYSVGTVRSYNGRLYKLVAQVVNQPVPPDPAPWWEEKTIDELKQDALSPAQMAAVNSGATAAKVATWDGYAAQIAAKANASDVAAALAQKASFADLPYRLVEPGEWAFSDGYPHVIDSDNFSGDWKIYADDAWPLNESGTYATEAEAQAVLDTLTSCSFTAPFGSVTATRASLPGHLLDRAVNAVSVSGDTTLTLPALVNEGKARDFLVRLAISGSTVPTITFAAPTGETITYETDGDEFPVPDAEGTWLYSFTETTAGVFAVSLKSVSTVTQGGNA